MNAANPIQRQEQIREERQSYIGGSDLHHLFNLKPYGCELQLMRKKLGQQPDIAFFGNDNTDRGNALEPLAAKRYTEVTGRELRKINVGKAHKDITFFRPTPDYEILNNARGPEWGPGLLSIKCPNKESFLKLKYAVDAWKNPNPNPTEYEKAQAERGRDTCLPYILQLQGELCAYGRKWGSFAFFNADLWKVVYFDVDFDPSIAEMLEEKLVVFWSKKTAGTLPDKLEATSSQCRGCEFRVSCQSEDLLKLLQSEGPEGDIATLPILDQLVGELREVEEIAAEAEKLVNDKKDNIKQVLSDCDVAQSEKFRVYHRLQSGRVTFNHKDFFKAHPEIEEKERKKFERISAPFRSLRVYDRIKKIDS